MNPQSSAKSSRAIPASEPDDVSIGTTAVASPGTPMPVPAPTGKPLVALDGRSDTSSNVSTIRRASSRPARAAAIAAVAAASMISGNAKADAAANMNLGYDFLGEVADEQRPSVPSGNGVPEMVESMPDESSPPSSAAPIDEEGSNRTAGRSSRASAKAFDRAELPTRLAEAESLYREARYDEAQRAFSAIVATDPAHAHAWLRIGNLMHRKRNWFDALSAYRKAARPQADLAIREKAVYNIALLNLELARHALRRLEKMRNEAAGTGEPLPKPGVSDASVRHLSDQLGNAYVSVAATRRSDAGAPAPRTSKALPLDKPVEVEIRQGGGAQ